MNARSGFRPQKNTSHVRTPPLGILVYGDFTIITRLTILIVKSYPFFYRVYFCWGGLNRNLRTAFFNYNALPPLRRRKIQNVQGA